MNMSNIQTAAHALTSPAAWAEATERAKVMAQDGAGKAKWVRLYANLLAGDVARVTARATPAAGGARKAAFLAVPEIAARTRKAGKRKGKAAVKVAAAPSRIDALEASFLRLESLLGQITALAPKGKAAK